jgi:release factor glutamine methyltransferase
VTLKSCLDHYEALVESHNQSSFIVKYFVMELLKMSPTDMYLHQNQILDDKTLQMIDSKFQLYIESQIPIGHILGYSYFMGYRFNVNEDVLIPRIETEELVEDALIYLDNMPSPSVLDLGTGSGCIGITIKKELPSSHVTLADISENALKVAKDNAHQLEVEVEIVLSDWFTNIEGTYDLIIANPPYIPNFEEVGNTVDKEPSLALYGGIEGLDHYETILKHAHHYLKPNGALAFEHGFQHQAPLKQLIRTYFPHANIETKQDMQEKDRFTWVYLK